RDADDDAGQLPEPAAVDEPADDAVLAARVGRAVDDLLLGVVDRVGALRRRVLRADLVRAHGALVRARRGRGAGAGELPVVRGVRRHGAVPADPRRYRTAVGARP